MHLQIDVGQWHGAVAAAGVDDDLYLRGRIHFVSNLVLAGISVRARTIILNARSRVCEHG
jgi:hypothetical protein